MASDGLLSRRAQATIAAGVLALGGAAAPAALAVEPDQEQEGTAAPVVGGGDTADDPGLDPGGDDPTLEVETGPVGGSPGAGGEADSGESAPVESEPADDPDARLVLTEPPAPVPEQLDASTPTLPQPAPALPTESPGPAPPAADIEHPGRGEAPRTLRKRKAPKRTVKLREPAGQRVTDPSPPKQPVSSAPVEIPAASARPATVPVSQPATAADPVTGPSYRVRPGDSLWSIARHVLGPDASAGQIARAVNRLWELNQERIGTGNPSLVHVGTVLRLR